MLAWSADRLIGRCAVDRLILCSAARLMLGRLAHLSDDYQAGRLYLRCLLMHDWSIARVIGKCFAGLLAWLRGCWADRVLPGRLGGLVD